MLGSAEPFFTSIAKTEHSADYSSEILRVEVAGGVAAISIAERGYGGNIDFVDHFHLLEEGGEWKIYSKLFHGRTKPPAPTDAAQEEAAVRAVLQRYIEGTLRGDEVTLRSVFDASAVRNGFAGSEAVRGSPEPFFKNISRIHHASTYSSAVVFVQVSGHAACATVTEEGYGGNLDSTHYFHLLKRDGLWKIYSQSFQGNER